MRLHGSGEMALAADPESAHVLDPLRRRASRNAVPERQQPGALNDRPEPVALEVEATVLRPEPAEKADRRLVAARGLGKLPKERWRLARRAPPPRAEAAYHT